MNQSLFSSYHVILSLVLSCTLMAMPNYIIKSRMDSNTSRQTELQTISMNQKFDLELQHNYIMWTVKCEVIGRRWPFFCARLRKKNYVTSISWVLMLGWKMQRQDRLIFKCYLRRIESQSMSFLNTSTTLTLFNRRWHRSTTPNKTKKICTLFKLIQPSNMLTLSCLEKKIKIWIRGKKVQYITENRDLLKLVAWKLNFQ